MEHAYKIYMCIFSIVPDYETARKIIDCAKVMY